MKVKAYGKVNLTLDVKGLLEDGYHRIETLLCGLRLYDEIEIEKAEEGIEVLCSKELGDPKKNLAYLAADILKKDFPQISGVRIKVQKNIPVAAGLAGGSSDAAAVLLGMKELFSLELSQKDLTEYGKRIGSDVPFLLKPTLAVGRERGEELEYLNIPAGLFVVLLPFDFGLSAKEVYEELDKKEIAFHPELKKVLQALEKADMEQFFESMGNVLEIPAFALRQEVKEKLDEAKKWARNGRVMMSGSGPTLCGFFEAMDDAIAFAEHFKNEAIFTSTLV